MQRHVPYFAASFFSYGVLGLFDDHDAHKIINIIDAINENSNIA